MSFISRSSSQPSQCTEDSFWLPMISRTRITGLAVIEALILAKVIMIGAVFRLGRGLEQKPLIYPTLYKTAVFTLFLGIFTVIENVVKVLWRGTGFTGDIADFSGERAQ